MKMLVDKFILLLLLFVVVSCGSSSIKMNKYMFEDFNIKNDSSISFDGKTILISSIDQSPIMRNGNIPYKFNSVRVNYFIGDKWVARVDELFKRNLFDALRKSNMFKDVFTNIGLTPADYYLSVYIDYLGEELIDKKRYATVKFDLRFADGNSKTIFYDKIYNKTLIKDGINDENYVSKLVQKLSKNISNSLAISFKKFYNSKNN